MSGTEYKMTFENSTDQPWHFGVYQKNPESPGLTSVAWQVRGVPPQEGDKPSSAQVNWTMQYGICICQFRQRLQRLHRKTICQGQSRQHIPNRFERRYSQH